MAENTYINLAFASMNFADKILDFYQSLYLDNSKLPQGIEVMNPFQDTQVQKVMGEFYRKFFSDEQQRYMVIGINPGRFGGGVTGYHLQTHINFRENAILR